MNQIIFKLNNQLIKCKFKINVRNNTSAVITANRFL